MVVVSNDECRFNFHCWPPFNGSSPVIHVFKYVITEWNSEIGYQFAAAVHRESGKQSRYHAERYVYNSLGYAYIYMYILTIKVFTGCRMFTKTGWKFNDVLVKKFYSYKYNSNKIFGDPVASLSGKMLTDISTKNLLLLVGSPKILLRL